MMVARFSYVVIFSALLAGLLPGGGKEASPIALFLDFERTPSDISLQEMKKEVGHLMESSGFAFDWKKASQMKKGEPDSILLKFKGTCHTGGPQPPQISELAPYGETLALASTKVSKGQVQPLSEVQCDQIRKCLGAGSNAGKMQRDLLLGRAMGRVVAHELYHILAATTKHAGEGLAKAVQSTADLLSEGSEFGSAQMERLNGSAQSGAPGFRRK
ncbi:MAG: hypothetical protein IT158_29890 [Bryobacterales bacterium]|nr:hypothetical protein [Bryobacterales bacterium]